MKKGKGKSCPNHSSPRQLLIPRHSKRVQSRREKAKPVWRFVDPAMQRPSSDHGVGAGSSGLLSPPYGHQAAFISQACHVETVEGAADGREGGGDQGVRQKQPKESVTGS